MRAMRVRLTGQHESEWEVQMNVVDELEKTMIVEEIESMNDVEQMSDVVELEQLIGIEGHATKSDGACYMFGNSFYFDIRRPGVQA